MQTYPRNSKKYNALKERKHYYIIVKNQVFKINLRMKVRKERYLSARRNKQGIIYHLPLVVTFYICPNISRYNSKYFMWNYSESDK